MIYNLSFTANHENVGEHIDMNTSYFHFGLFGNIKNSVIKNLTIKNVLILNGMGNNYTRSNQGTAALVGYTSGNTLINNVKILGNIIIEGEYKVGGIVGSSGGESITLKNCAVRGENNSFIGGTDEKFKDTNNFGGLIGFTATSNTIIENVISDIDVYGFTSGGICGNVTEGNLSMKNVSVYGEISNNEGSVVGGLVGGRFVNMSLENCFIMGKINSKDNSYSDICVSLYGDKDVVININNVYFNNDNFDNNKISNSLDIIGLSKTEIESKIPKELR